MKDILNKFLEEIKKAYGDNLKSVVLYGSKASGEDTKKYSDYNLLVVLEEIQFNDLKSLNKAIGPWIRNGNQPPLLFTADRLKKSADVFPIEFLDMKSNHKILHGEDPFSELKIHDTHLRHECEFELKGKLLKLRQGYMIARGKPDKLRQLLIDSITTFLIISQHVLRLLGEPSQAKRLDALNILADKTGLNPSVFVNIVKIKQGDKEARKLDPEKIFEEYIKEIEKIVDLVDNL